MRRKENFDALQRIRDKINEVEVGLQSLRDYVDLGAKARINRALIRAGDLRSAVWEIDAYLENADG